jgi:uncharacterized membrane protein YhaH (DUF805 family)
MIKDIAHQLRAQIPASTDPAWLERMARQAADRGDQMKLSTAEANAGSRRTFWSNDVDEAFKQKLASLSLQLAARLDESPPPVAQPVETAPRTDGSLLFGFRGRVNRARFWLVLLGVFAVELTIFGLLNSAGLAFNAREQIGGVGMLANLALLALFGAGAWIWLAVTVKRLHDRQKCGWWALVLFLPLIGVPWYLLECGLLRGTEGYNRYGQDLLLRY